MRLKDHRRPALPPVCPRLLAAGALLLVLFAGGGLVPTEATESAYPWEQTFARRLTGGLFEWTPEPFVFKAGDSVRYIDFEGGDDEQDGASPKTAWKHHPWDASATRLAAEAAGIHTYVFKGGVAYRGRLVADESGTPGNPIRLTRKPDWGRGPAMLQASIALKDGWQQLPEGERPAHLPQPEKVWYQDLDHPFPIYSLWEVTGNKVVRIALARTPNWKHQTWDDVHSDKAVWKEVRAASGEARTAPHVQVGSDQAWAADQEVFNDPDPKAYDGAVVWTEYAGLMGSPYAIPVEEYDPGRHAVRIAAPWTGKRKPMAGCRYFVEGLPRFLDEPGEFFYDVEKGRLYLRLSDDRDPNKSTIEVPQWVNHLDLSGRRHIEVTGLSFRFQRTHNVFHRYWDQVDQDAQCIRILGSADGIRIANNRFEHVVTAIWAETGSPAAHIGTLTIEDNEIAHADRHAIIVYSSGAGDGAPNGPIDEVRILRNRIHDVGVRPRRASHGHTLCARYVTELLIAGNILDKTYGAGIFVHGGKGGGDASEIPLTRILILQNQVEDSNLASNDWGGIETWQGGYAYVFDNVSLNPGGYWKYLDVIDNDNWQEVRRDLIQRYPKKDFPYVTQAMSVAGIYEREGRNAYSARFAYALYMDGAFKQYWFNNIAGGNESDPASPRCNTGGIHAVAGSFMSAIFNNVFYRFGLASARGGTFPAPNLFLGNTVQDMGDLFLRHERARARPDEKLIRLPDADPEGFAKGTDSITLMEAIGANVFQGTPAHFGTFERSGKMWPDLASFRDAFGRYFPVRGDVGAVVDGPLLRDPANKDFRPVAGSAAATNQVLVFVPWALSGTVGEWGFYPLPAEPTRIVGEHWFMTEEHIDRGMYRRLPRHDLTAVHVTAENYTRGILEDWTQGALALDGEEQHLVFTHANMTAGLEWDERGEKKSFPGRKRRTLDMDTNNFLVEAVLRIEKGWQGGGIVQKQRDQTGYQFALTQDGRPYLTLFAGEGQALTATLPTALNDGYFHHLIAEVDRAGDSGIQFYLDGEPVAATLEGDLPDAVVSLSNEGDFVVGQDAEGSHLKATFDFLRICRGTLADARTDIKELYHWQFAGPCLRTWSGAPVVD